MQRGGPAWPGRESAAGSVRPRRHYWEPPIPPQPDLHDATTVRAGCDGAASIAVVPGIGEGKVLDAGGSGRRLRRRRPLHPNVRRSPYFRATEEAGAVEYMVYNHMYMP